MATESGDLPAGQRPPSSVWPRLLLGVIVLVGAEVFSGATLKIGLWHPWTLIVTFWLYFAHFFFFTTLEVWTGRTSFWSLYLWGVLFGLYEAWITKVIWYGYDGNGKFVLGSLGPFGFSELSMVFIFHALMSFILPLAFACLWFPSLRSHFPDLAWFTSAGKWARIFRIYLIINFGVIVAMNSGGPLNLALNLVFIAAVLWLLRRLSGPHFLREDAQSVIVFKPSGFVILCAYLLLLYAVTYLKLRPEGLPSAPIQLFTAALYFVIIAGLWLQRSQKPFATPKPVEPGELKAARATVMSVLGLGFVLSFLHGNPALFIPVVIGFILWTPAGILLLIIAILKAIAEIRNPPTARV